MSKAVEAKNKLEHSLCDDIEMLTKKFPSDQRRSAVLMALAMVQKRYGHLSHWQLAQVADILDMSEIEVNEVASFYDLFTFEKKGQFVLKVCDSISCYLCESGKILSYLQHKLKVELGQISTDGLFTVESAPCLAKCADAPVIIVNDESYHLNMNEQKVDALIEQLQKKGIKDQSNQIEGEEA